MTVPIHRKPVNVMMLKWLIGLALVFTAVFQLLPANAQEPVETQSPNETCIACHGNPDLKISFMSGETVDLATNLKEYWAVV